jgi:hypothetical protein
MTRCLCTWLFSSFPLLFPAYLPITHICYEDNTPNKKQWGAGMESGFCAQVASEIFRGA